MLRAPASRLFYNSSLTIDAGRSTTSPAAIWLISVSSRRRIRVRAAAVIAAHYMNQAPHSGKAPATEATGVGVARVSSARFSPPPPSQSKFPMEGINWLDLFDAMDMFLVSIVEKNVMLVDRLGQLAGHPPNAFHDAAGLIDDSSEVWVTKVGNT